MKSLFAYPGNKQKLIPSLVVPSDTKTFIDPFFGAGSFTLAMFDQYPNKKFVIGEADKNILEIIKACQSNKARSVVIDDAKKLKQKFLLNPRQTWEEIKTNLLTGCPASKLIHQRLAFGAVARKKSNGEYNVIYSNDKARALTNWIPALPDLSECDLTICNDWKQCFSVPGLDYSAAIALIDPPYYAPGKTSCYPSHQPNSIKTALMITSTVDVALATGLSKFWLTHYDVELVQDFLNQIDSPCYTVSKTVGQELKQLGQGIGNYKNGSRVQPKIIYRDCVWEWSNTKKES